MDAMGQFEAKILGGNQTVGESSRLLGAIIDLTNNTQKKQGQPSCISSPVFCHHLPATRTLLIFLLMHDHVVRICMPGFSYGEM